MIGPHDRRLQRAVDYDRGGGGGGGGGGGTEPPDSAQEVVQISTGDLVQIVLLLTRSVSDLTTAAAMMNQSRNADAHVWLERTSANIDGIVSLLRDKMEESDDASQ